MPRWPNRTAAERFIERVTIDGDCLIWIGGKNSKGYGVLRNEEGKHELAHRFAYRTYIGPIPDGYDIDHACHCRRLTCITPSRLDAVTPQRNRELQTQRAREQRLLA